MDAASLRGRGIRLSNEICVGKVASRLAATRFGIVPAWGRILARSFCSEKMAADQLHFSSWRWDFPRETHFFLKKAVRIQSHNGARSFYRTPDTKFRTIFQVTNWCIYRARSLTLSENAGTYRNRDKDWG